MNLSLSGPVLDRSTAGVAAMVTAYERLDALCETLESLGRCCPAPAEILVHVDGSPGELVAVVKERFPRVRVFESSERLGPGGARNLMIQSSTCRWVASFDDDSRPLDMDYFGRAQRLMEDFPQADLLAAKIYIRGQTVLPASGLVERVSDFVGCGCVYRRESFLRTTGYVPLPLAYAMEEVDLALRMCAEEQVILECGELRVFHDTDYSNHKNKVVTAVGIRNQVLHAYLRYPLLALPLALLQCAARVWWLIREGRRAGIMEGFAGIPTCVWSYRKHRNPVTLRSLASYLRLRRNAYPVSKSKIMSPPAL